MSRGYLLRRFSPWCLSPFVLVYVDGVKELPILTVENPREKDEA
jgi:hypothetical protein